MYDKIMIWAKLHCPPKIFWAGTAMVGGTTERRYMNKILNNAKLLHAVVLGAGKRNKKKSRRS